MKIALLIDSLGSGGAQRQIANLSVELKRNGHDVTLVRYYNDDFYLNLLENSGVNVTHISADNVVFRIAKIRNFLKKLRPDVLISFMGTPNFYASVASVGKHPWKLIISERIANESLFVSMKSKFFRIIQSRFADVVVCNSKSAESLWKKYFPKTESKLHTIYNIIEVPDIAVNSQHVGKCRLVVAARYESEKNLDGMLRAVACLSEEERDRLEIHWYGRSVDSSASESVLGRGEEFIKQNDLENCVFLHSATDRIYPIMAEADFISLFSFMEGLPNAIIEGMTLKKPVVMSKVSDYAVLVDEKNGFLCDPRSPEDIANALRQAINTTSEQRAEMGQVSYEKIKKICSRDAVVAQWENMIRQ